MTPPRINDGFDWLGQENNTPRSANDFDIEEHKLYSHAILQRAEKGEITIKQGDEVLISFKFEKA